MVISNGSFGTPFHSTREHVDLQVNYPDHEPRTESAEYRKTHHSLVNDMDIGCFICGKKASQGSKNETHHYFCEWSAMKAIDWAGKFAQEAAYMHNPQSGRCIGTKFDWKAVAENPTLFVDSKDNMVVLCPTHHRSPSEGIHHVPYPIWILQRYPVAGFEFTEEVPHDA